MTNRELGRCENCPRKDKCTPEEEYTCEQMINIQESEKLDVEVNKDE